MELSAYTAREIANSKFYLTEKKVQSWVFRKIKRNARRGRYFCETYRTLTKDTEEKLEQLGYVVETHDPMIAKAGQYKLIQW